MEKDSAQGEVGDIELGGLFLEDASPSEILPPDILKVQKQEKIRRLSEKNNVMNDLMKSELRERLEKRVWKENWIESECQIIKQIFLLISLLICMTWTQIMVLVQHQSVEIVINF